MGWIFRAGTQQQEFQEQFFKMKTSGDLQSNHLKCKLQMQKQKPDPRLSEWELFSVEAQKSDF